MKNVAEIVSSKEERRMTLDMELYVPEYSAELYYHSSRSPNEEMIKKICESLDLAREIVKDADTQACVRAS